MERDRGPRAACAGKAPRKRRRASPLPGTAAPPSSRAGVSQMCRRRLFGSAGPRGPEPACKRLSRAAAGLGVQETGPVPAGKGGGKRTLRCALSGVFAWVEMLGRVIRPRFSPIAFSVSPPEVCSSHVRPAQRVLCEAGKWFLVNHVPYRLEKADRCSRNRNVVF